MGGGGEGGEVTYLPFLPSQHTGPDKNISLVVCAIIDHWVTCILAFGP